MPDRHLAAALRAAAPTPDPAPAAPRVVCPLCRGPLGSQPSGARSCAACARIYAPRDGFVDFIIGDRFDDASDEALLAYEERSNADLTNQYWIPRFRALLGARAAGARVLSVGCGTGVDVDLLRAAGFDACGIDCGNRCQVWSRRTHKDRLFLADGQHLPFPDASFDLVFCGCVFPHVGVVGDSAQVRPDHREARGQLAAEMARVLAPGGHVVASSPNRLFPLDLFHGRRPGSYKPRLNPPSSPFLLSARDYAEMFGAHGCGRPRPLPPQDYWGFIRSRHSPKGWLLGLPVRAVFSAVSTEALAALRASPINPWLVMSFTRTGGAAS